MAYTVGTAQINVGPDLRGFREKLNKQWKREMADFAKDDKNNVKIGVDDKHLNAELVKAEKKIDALVKRRRVVDITAKFNSSRFRKQIKDALNSVQSSIKADVDTGDADKKLSKAAAKRTVKFDLDESALDKYMRNRRNLGIATLRVELSGAADAEARLAHIARERSVDLKINKIGNEKLNVAKSTTANVRLIADIADMRNHVEASTRIRPVKVFGKLVVDTKEARRHLEAWTAKRQPKITVGIDLNEGQATEVFDRLDRKIDRKMSVKVDTKKAKSELDDLMVRVGTIGNMLTRMAFMGGIFTTAGIGAAGATPAVAAFGGALASVAKAGLVAPAVIGATTASIGALALGLAGTSNAFTDLTSSAKEGAISLEDFDTATENLSDGAKDFMRSLYMADEGTQSFFQSLMDVQKAAQNSMFDGLNRGLDTVKTKLGESFGEGVTNLDALSEQFSSLSRILGDTAANWASIRFSDTGFRDMLTQLQNTKLGLAQLSVATMNWSKMWNDLSTVGSAFLPGIGEGVEGITRSMSNWTEEARRTGRLTYMISGGIESAKTIGEAAGGVFRIMGDVLNAAGMNARGMSESIGDAVKKVEGFTSSMEGQSSMASFFADAKAVGSEMSQTFMAVGRVLAEHVVPILSEFIQGAGPGLRDAIGGAAPLLDAIAPSARTLGEAVGRMARGFQEFGKMVSPIVSGVLPAISEAFKLLAPAIGGLAAPTVTLLALASALNKLKPVGAALGFMLGGDKGLPSRFLAMGVAATSLTGTLSPLIGILTTLNSALGGIPATALGLLAIAKQFNGPLSNMGNLFRRSTSEAIAFGSGIKAAEDPLKAVPAHIITTNNALTKANSGFKTFGTTLGSMRDRFTIFAAGKSSVEMVGGAATVAGQKFKQMGGLAKSAMTNISNMFGGPGMMGLMAGIAVVSQVVDSFKSYNNYVAKAAEISADMKHASGDMFEAITSGSTELEASTNMVQGYINKLGELEDINAFSKFTANFSRWTGLEGSLDKANKEQQDAYTAAKDFESALSELGMTSEDVGRKLNGSRQEWAKFKETLADEGVWDSTLADLDEYYDAAQRAAKSANDLGPGGTAVKQTMEEIAESAGRAAGDLEKFTEAMSELNGSSTSAIEATANLTETLDQISAAQMGIDFSAFDQAKGKIDPTTTAGAALTGVLKDIRTDLLDVAESGGDIDAAFDQARPTLESLATAAGMSWDQMEALLTQFGMMPDTIKTNVEVLTDDAARSVTAIKNSLEGVKQGEWTAPINIKNKAALDAIEATGVELKSLGDDNYKFKIDADNSYARAKVNATQELFAKFGEEKATAMLDANIDPLVLAAQDASHVLDYNIKDKTIHIAAEGADAATAAAQALGWEVEKVPNSKEVIIHAGSVKDATALVQNLGIETRKGKNGTVLIEDSSTQAAIDLLIALGAAVRDPKTGEVIINNADGPAVLQNLRDINGAVGDKRQTITTEYVEIHTLIQNAQQGVNKTSDPGTRAEKQYYLDQLNADGGMLEGYAIGGKLPTSGPGTNVTDGIYGVDASGVAFARVDAGEWVINAKSSEKYNGLLAAINEDRLPGFAGGGVAPGTKKRSDQDILNGMASGLTSGFGKGVANSKAGTALRNAPGAIGEGLAIGSGLLAGATGVNEIMNVPAMWEQASAQVESQWSDFQTVATNAFDNVSGTIATAFTNIDSNIRTTWGGTSTYLSGSIDTLSGTFDTGTQEIQSVWANTGTQLGNVYNSGMVPVFQGLDGAVNQSVVGFQNGATGIGNAWSAVRENTAAPVRYAIGTVFNGGLVGMWNSASELLGLSTMNAYPLAFATGGAVNGPGGPTEDKIPAMLSDGEYVINAAATRKIGLRNLDALNSGNMSFAANAFRDKTFENVAIKRASGGPVKGTPAWRQLKRGYDWARSRDGRPYVWGGSANGGGGADCSGFMSGIADVILGGDGTRQWATMNFPGGQQGAWGPGLGAGFAVGISDVHTAGTIGGVEGMPAVNVESGGINSRMKFGAADAAGADDGQFNRQFHMLVGGGGAFKPGMGRSGGASIASLVAEATDPWREKVKAALSGYTGRGMIGNLPNATGTKQYNAMDNVISEAAAAMQATAGAAGVDLTGIDGDTVAQVKEVFARHGWTGGEWDAAQWIIGKESGWDPQATNPSSGAYGLFQFLGSTKDQYLPGPDYSVPTQADAGARYIKDRYGSPTAAKSFWEANNWYDNGGYLKPGTTIANNETGKPEPVFTNEQWGTLKDNISSNADLAESVRESAEEEKKEPTPIISVSQWDQIAASIVAKAKAGDIDGLNYEANHIKDIVLAAIDEVDWAEVGEEIGKEVVDGIVDGQVDDALGVLGIPSLDSIPLVAASNQLQEDLASTREEEASALESANSDYTSADQSVQDKEKSLTEAQEKLAELQADLSEAEDDEKRKSVQDQINDQNERIAELEKELAEAKQQRVDAESEANRLTGDAYTGNSTYAMTPYVADDEDSDTGTTTKSAPVSATKVATTAPAKSNLASSPAVMSSLLTAAGAIDPAVGAAASFAATGINAVSNAVNNAPRNVTYNIHAASVDEGMRRAEMHNRQSVARAGNLR